MTKRELKEWWDSDEEETSWGESALPILGLMVLVMLAFVGIMVFISNQ